MKHKFLFAVLFAFCPMAQAEEPYSFKEFTLGKSLAETASASNLECNSPVKPSAYFDKICFSETTFAGVPGRLIVTAQSDAIITIAIKMSNQDFKLVESAMIEKYGKKFSLEEHVLTGAFGMQYPSKEYIWENSVSRVQLEQIYKNVDEMMVTYVLHSGLSSAGTRLKEEAKKRAGDI